MLVGLQPPSSRCLHFFFGCCHFWSCGCCCCTTNDVQPQHTLKINFHLATWWIIITIFRCLEFRIHFTMFLLSFHLLFVMRAHTSTTIQRCASPARLIKKVLPLTIAICIVCRASLGIFGAFFGVKQVEYTVHARITAREWEIARPTHASRNEWH